MTRAEPERHNGVGLHADVAADSTCPAEQGQFGSTTTIPMENIVDYELGGAEGTFLFDATTR